MAMSADARIRSSAFPELLTQNLIRLYAIQPEIGAEINPLDLLVGRQLRRRAALEDHAGVDDVRAVGDFQRLAHIMVRNEHADATFFQVKDDLLDIGDRDRVDAGERLVEQDELRAKSPARA